MNVDPPENVRIELRNGEVIPCELVYEGVRDGAHRWVVVTLVPLAEIKAIRADKIPGKTSISIGVAE